MNSNKKYQGKYRIDSIRKKGHDYSSLGLYFITIDTKNMKDYFGKIKNGKMGKSQLGAIAEECWNAIPYHFPNVELDEFVIMPNHVHGIIWLAETQNLASVPKLNKFGPQSKNLASIIRGFKIGVTKYARINKFDFQWQSNYYDCIVHSNSDLERIRSYIRNNPSNYKK